MPRVLGVGSTSRGQEAKGEGILWQEPLWFLQKETGETE